MLQSSYLPSEFCHELSVGKTRFHHVLYHRLHREQNNLSVQGENRQVCKEDTYYKVLVV